MSGDEPRTRARRRGTQDGRDTLVARSTFEAVRVTGAQLEKDPLPSQDADRYERLDLLGEGGMGQVWLTRDGRIGRRVAQKELYDDASDRPTQDAFLREARLQGQLEHPAIVPVYDVGRSADGKLYFTMKRVRGVTLAEVIAHAQDGDEATLERFTQRRLLTAFCGIALAVEYAHERGVIHRDLKPQNLMLGDYGEIYVLDWGVATVLREDTELEMNIDAAALAASDATGSRLDLVGTPGYIAPELLRGGTVGPRSDVFALGAILYEILVRAPLLGGDNVVQRLANTLEPIDVPRLVAEHDRDAPPELVAVCAKATAFDPAQRYESCRELNDAVERWIDGQRDLELRRRLAERHVADARAAMAGRDLESHRRALQGAGRALAIKPDDPEARSLILALFAEEPREAPPEVEQAIVDARAAQSRITARTSASGMASMLGFIPVLALIGIRNWAAIAFYVAMIVAATLVSVAALRKKRDPGALLYAGAWANNVVFSLSAAFYGPLIMVPAMVITNTVSVGLHLDRARRNAVVASASLAVVVPVALQLLHVLPASYEAMGDGLFIRPHWVALPATVTISFMTIATLVALVNGARAVAVVRDELTNAERRLQTQAWRLQQLLPEASSDG